MKNKLSKIIKPIAIIGIILCVIIVTSLIILEYNTSSNSKEQAAFNELTNIIEQMNNEKEAIEKFGKPRHERLLIQET